MISKRIAIQAMFMGVLAKMAHADEPMKDITLSQGSVFALSMQGPLEWVCHIDQMSFLVIRYKGETVKIPADEVFAALKS